MRWVQLCGSLNILWHCLSSGLEWNLNFSSPVATAEFSKLAGICSSLTGSSFRIWNISVEIPSPLLALFIVMLPKAHLTSLSRMYSSRWVITPSWLSGSWISFMGQLLENQSAVWDLGLIPGLGRSSGEGSDYPVQYSGLQYSMDSYRDSYNMSSLG